MDSNTRYPTNGFEQFVRNMSIKTGKPIDQSFVYLIQTEDLDGNITDEKYGINLTQDTMMTKGTYGWNNYMVCLVKTNGSGNIASTYANSVFNGNWEYISTGLTFSRNRYPMTYDSTTGMISQRYRIGNAVYDYNYTSITSDFVADRLCVVTGSPTTFVNSMLTNVSVYDVNGNYSAITKHPNEKLTITIYGSISIHEDCISDAYDDGVFVAIEPYYQSIVDGGMIFMGTNNLRFSNPSYSQILSNRPSPQPVEYFSIGSTSYLDYGLNVNGYTSGRSYVNAEQLIEDSRIYFSMIATYNNEYILMLHPVRMSTSEELVSTDVYTNTYDTDEISNSFARFVIDTTTNQHVFPVVDFHMTDSKMYNHVTKDWDIQDQFTDRTTAWYDETIRTQYLFNYSGTDPDGNDKTIFMCINARDDIAVCKIKTSNSVKVYVTNKYWDPTTWSRVIDPTNITGTQQYFRYVMFDGNPGTVDGYRTQPVHEINASTTPYVITGTPTYTTKTGNCYMMKPLSSDTYKFILSRDDILFIDNGVCTYSYTLYGDTNNTPIDPLTFRYVFGSKIVVAPRGRNIPQNVRIYDASTFGVQPTFTDITIPSSVAEGTYIGYYSSSVNGYIGMFNRNSVNKACVLDVTNETTQVFDDVDMFHVQEFTNYAIYKILNSQPQTFVVYDLSTETIVDTFTLPDEYTQVIGICGCGDFVYLRDYSGSPVAYTSWLYRISTGSLELLNINVPLSMFVSNNTGASMESSYLRIPSNLTVAVYDQNGMTLSQQIISDVLYEDDTDAYYISFNTPTVINKLYKSGNVVTGTTSSYNELTNYNAAPLSGIGYASQLASLNTGKHLLLLNPKELRYVYNRWDIPNVGNEYHNIVCDFGYALDSGESLNQCYAHFPSTTIVNDSCGGACAFNGGVVMIDGGGVATWYPVERLLPHKVTGTTTTFQTYNNPKQYQFNEVSLGFSLTNRGDIVTTPTAPTPDSNGFVWCAGGAWSSSGSGSRLNVYVNPTPYNCLYSTRLDANGHQAIGNNRLLPVTAGTRIKLSFDIDTVSSGIGDTQIVKRWNAQVFDNTNHRISGSGYQPADGTTEWVVPYDGLLCIFVDAYNANQTDQTMILQLSFVNNIVVTITPA